MVVRIVNKEMVLIESRKMCRDKNLVDYLSGIKVKKTENKKK